jgi:hypothetical protein
MSRRPCLFQSRLLGMGRRTHDNVEALQTIHNDPDVWTIYPAMGTCPRSA